jgi:hypothetical protein
MLIFELLQKKRIEYPDSARREESIDTNFIEKKQEKKLDQFLGQSFVLAYWTNRALDQSFVFGLLDQSWCTGLCSGLQTSKNKICNV